MINKSELTKTTTKQSNSNNEFNALLNEASNYLLSFEWCGSILEVWLADNWDDLVTVFLLEIEPIGDEVDEEVWVVVGDIPPAYIDIESAPTKKDVMECYVRIMEDWVETVLTNGDMDECYPLDVPPTKKYATMLATRLELISTLIISSPPND